MSVRDWWVNILCLFSLNCENLDMFGAHQPTPTRTHQHRHTHTHTHTHRETQTFFLFKYLNAHKWILHRAIGTYTCASCSPVWKLCTKTAHLLICKRWQSFFSYTGPCPNILATPPPPPTGLHLKEEFPTPNDFFFYLQVFFLYLKVVNFSLQS